MRSHVVDLNRFYASPLGQATIGAVNHRVQTLWPTMSGRDLIGIGYAPEFLMPYRRSARRLICAMPASQGAHKWEGVQPGKNATCLIEEEMLPFSDASFDNALIVHGLESTSHPEQFLREIWRVMAPEGRLILIVPNRAGLWARSEVSPFGVGRPYSRRQLSEALRQCQFEPAHWSKALYIPPIKWWAGERSSEIWEQVGSRLWPGFSGLTLVEAVKRLYSKSGKTRPRRVFNPLSSWVEGATKPQGALNRWKSQ